MTIRDRAEAYLTIPPSYGEYLGGLRWSLRCDAIERQDGSTLVLVEEIAQLLEGVFRGPVVPPFAFVLILYAWIQCSDQLTPLDGLGRLGLAFNYVHGAGGVVGLYRNAGLLIAELCRDLPPATAAPSWSAVSTALKTRQQYGERHRPELAEEPPLTSSEFEQRISLRMRMFADPVLRHWLVHGCGPTPAGERLAEPVESLPVRVARLVARARKRPRLVGAAMLVPAVDAALTIPPRRSSDALPQGGYCDVVTRGDPERLLPGQFALDPDEFVRRFAEHELLFFKREEPHAAEKPQRVIVLDQGVRTWGRVRLALAAAALALLKKDAERVSRVRLALTSAAGLIDVTQASVEAVADHLEASDLTPHPNECLVGALHDPDATDGPRDVILLTHPRTVRDPATYSSGTRRPGDRVFALTVDEHGQAELGEWVNGALVPLRTFRVDLAEAEAARVERESVRSRTASPSPEWTGDVEPVGFPFRPGLVVEPSLLGFDADGEWLVMAGRSGILQGLALDGSPPEVLPRPFRGGAVLKQVDAILGVKDGVVVCGRMKPLIGVTISDRVAPPLGFTHVSSGTPVVSSSASDTAPPAVPSSTEILVAAHYDRTTRRVTLHMLSPAFTGSRWAAFPDLHCVAVSSILDGPTRPGCALDLTTHGRFPGPSDAELVSRARLAWNRAPMGSPPYTVPVGNRSPGSLSLWRPDTTRLQVRHANPQWVTFEPMQEGKPLLAGAIIHQAQLARDVLAIALSRSGERKLVLFRAPDGVVLGELEYDARHGPFALSPDGRLVARKRSREIEVSETADIATNVIKAAHAGLHTFLEIRLGADPFRLVLHIGNFEHTFWVERDQLAHVPRNLGERPARPDRRIPDAAIPVYDPTRFPLRTVTGAGRWWAVLDRLGQVLVFTDTGKQVAAFLIRRERAAAWAPGGVFWGDPALIGGPPTPDAERRIGLAIQNAMAEEFP